MSNRERTIESKGRIEFIDLAKGICILLVVMIHVGVPEYIPGLYAAKVPIFFLLSGLFFLKKVNFFLRGGGILPIFTILICWACIPLCLKLIPWFIAQKDLLPNPMPIRTK
jgi:uncharacterized membrane protein YcfT